MNERTKRKLYQDAYRKIRLKHLNRYFEQRANLYDNGVINVSNKYYAIGWIAITAFVSKTLGPTKYIVLGDKEELAIELAQKLSDLFFEYREKAILADAKNKE